MIASTLSVRCLLLFTAAIPCLLPLRAAAPPESTDTPATSGVFPKVLILGDSISIGYTPFVQEALAGEARVIRPTRTNSAPENCQGTLLGSTEIKRWLARDGGAWQVIHFNFGLHDMKRVDPGSGANSNDPSHPRQSEPGVYERRLRAIVRELKQTGAALVFATTTPVPEGGVRPHRDVGDPSRYNAIAQRIMAEEGVVVNDLYSFALPRLADIQQPVNVHFTEAGSRALAGEVVRHIRQTLKKRSGPGQQPGR